MAEEFVSTAQFGEFVKRMEDRFDHVQPCPLCGADNQRFDDMNRRMEQGFANLEKRLDFQNRMTLAVAITVGGGILVGLVKYLFFPG